MKFLLVLIAIVGLGKGAISTPVDTQRGLNADFEEFLELLPLSDILNTFISYSYDPEVLQAVLYVYSDDFKNLVIEVEALPEYDAVFGYIAETGLPVNKWIQLLHDALGIFRADMGSRAAGLRGLVDDLRAIINWDKLEEFYYHKTETSPAFKELFEKIHTDEFTGFIDGLVANQRIQDVIRRLTAAGIDIELLIDSLKDFFNYPNF